MQTVGIFQTFENYLFFAAINVRDSEGGWGSGARSETITGVQTEAAAQRGPGDSQHGHAVEVEGCGGFIFLYFFRVRGECLSRWRGLVILSTLERWIRLYPLNR